MAVEQQESPAPLPRQGWDSALYPYFMDSGDRQCFCTRLFGFRPREGKWLFPIYLDEIAGRHFMLGTLDWDSRTIELRDSLPTPFAGTRQEVFKTWPPA